MRNRKYKNNFVWLLRNEIEKISFWRNENGKWQINLYATQPIKNTVYCEMDSGKSKPITQEFVVDGK